MVTVVPAHLVISREIQVFSLLVDRAKYDNTTVKQVHFEGCDTCDQNPQPANTPVLSFDRHQKVCISASLNTSAVSAPQALNKLVALPDIGYAQQKSGLLKLYYRHVNDRFRQLGSTAGKA